MLGKRKAHQPPPKPRPTGPQIGPISPPTTAAPSPEPASTRAVLAGRLILHIFAALGQFEVELLRERPALLWPLVVPVAELVVGRRHGIDAMKITAAKAMLSSGTMTAAKSPGKWGAALHLYRYVPDGPLWLLRPRPGYRRSPDLHRLHSRLHAEVIRDEFGNPIMGCVRLRVSGIGFALHLRSGV